MTPSLSSDDEKRVAAPCEEPAAFESVPALACASALFILGTLSTLITPALLQGWTTEFGWEEARLGWIAMIELAGLALGSVSAFFWQKRYNWRRVSGWSVVMIIATNAACTVMTSFSLLCAARLVSGAAGGVLVGVYTAYLSNTRSPERYLAVTTLLQILAQAAMMSLSSVLLGRWGMNGMYAMLGGIVAVLLPAIRHLPAGWPKSTAGGDGEVAPHDGIGRSWIAGLLMLAAFVPFEIFQGGTFAFLHQFGERGAGLDSGHTLHIIGMAAIGSGAGPIAAYFLADRLGVIVPLAGSMLVMLAVSVGLATPPYSSIALLFYLSLLQASWLFATCYLYAGLIKVNNVLTQAGSPLSALCLAIGASVMGVTIEGYGLAGMFWLSVTCLVLTTAAVLPPLYLAERRRIEA